MKIEAVEVWSTTLKLKEPSVIAYETIENVEIIFLRIITTSNIIGCGCAAPALNVTGERFEDTLRAGTDIGIPLLKNADPLLRAAILEQAKINLQSYPSLLAAIDMALYDILGKKAGLPLWQLLGGYRDCIATSITIGITSLLETVERALMRISQGFKILKLKGGKNLHEDIERVIKTRETVGENIELRFDANQGYSVQESLEFVRETAIANIVIFEQPTHSDHFDALGVVSRSSAIPVMADESLLNLVDAFHLARGRLVDMVNIKLMKVGGISEAFHINSVAKAAGFETMVGCVEEPGLSIAAGLHFALSRPNVLYADLDGHFSICDDPTGEAVLLDGGILRPTGQPGIGFDIQD